jgi:hypothetical protein
MVGNLPAEGNTKPCQIRFPFWKKLTLFYCFLARGVYHGPGIAVKRYFEHSFAALYASVHRGSGPLDALMSDSMMVCDILHAAVIEASGG